MCSLLGLICGFTPEMFWLGSLARVSCFLHAIARCPVTVRLAVSIMNLVLIVAGTGDGKFGGLVPRASASVVQEMFVEPNSYLLTQAGKQMIECCFGKQMLLEIPTMRAEVACIDISQLCVFLKQETALDCLDCDARWIKSESWRKLQCPFCNSGKCQRGNLAHCRGRSPPHR